MTLALNIHDEISLHLYVVNVEWYSCFTSKWVEVREGWAPSRAPQPLACTLRCARCGIHTLFLPMLVSLYLGYTVPW